ncbi:hypothetical protein N7E70_016870 [Aminobacter sp. NyZ550]|jgi:hypothetical protein|uniref:Uncharacterized protein HemY n=2 Tax=Aminobacter TaxID=31988 RepID=A0A142M7S7_AMIAI|nr:MULTISPECIES: hypothetical protein [Aminobacter]AMS42397.1 hypothetical protein AA2016_3475 [Aminobacter aminovorans]MBA8909776.1 uncharacterized protein HemY [Aminobacter ciceronei]MBA9023548.1 uncharacterized protein HemY [Aminobacter ciceronei]MBB3709826.1 uncharacterized protein HemY [Aminobacter aminovorans]QNH32508.1 hypothetical protein H5P29_18395 [Aminobacter sp. MDW-2]
MIRFVIIAVVVIVAWLLLLKLFRQMKEARVDWTGIATIIGFIVLAIYLHYVTGIG